MDSEQFAKKIRIDAATMLCRTRDSHIGGGYSSADLLAVLYTRILNLSLDQLGDPNRNIFILSKGHIAATMYAVLANQGLIPKEHLAHHLEDGGNYAGHTRRFVVPGIEASAGSLGHGLPVGMGMAYAKRLQGYGGGVYVLMGDGECNEGSVWEAAMFGARFQLGKLAFIVDRNHLQAYGRDEQVLNMGDLRAKFEAFGCHAVEIDGHDHGAIYEALHRACQEDYAPPTAIIANTIKGKGATFMEDRLEWHFKSPSEEQLAQIIKEQGL